ncbi:MAG TPA: WGR domain-containing protein [Haliangium sp.]|nr:WGR domain-containing protein [Haliangium sp.]
MSEAWTVHLVFTDDRSNKFWRGRTEGGTLYINYGRVGSSGQTTTKEMDSQAEAEAELAKQAEGKRRKGYVDAEGGAPAAPVEVAAEPQAPPGPRLLRLRSGGRHIDVRLSVEGNLLRTEVVETFGSPEAAAAALARIEQAMAGEGYRRE